MFTFGYAFCNADFNINFGYLTYVLGPSGKVVKYIFNLPEDDRTKGGA